MPIALIMDMNTGTRMIMAASISMKHPTIKRKTLIYSSIGLCWSWIYPRSSSFRKKSIQM
jgi:hypothetical protein